LLELERTREPRKMLEIEQAVADEELKQAIAISGGATNKYNEAARPRLIKDRYEPRREVG
jgi:hypothetical protein